MSGDLKPAISSGNCKIFHERVECVGLPHGLNMRREAKPRKAGEPLEQGGEWIIVIFMDIGKKVE